MSKPNKKCEVTRFKAPPGDKPRLMVAFSLQRDTVAGLGRAATRCNRSRSWIVDMAVTRFLPAILEDPSIIEEGA